MSMPYSPTSPRPRAMSNYRSDHKLPPISQLPDVYTHAARPQSPPTSPESVTGSSQSSPKRRMSDQNELHDLLDRNRRKRSATSAQVLGAAAMSDDMRPEPALPSPKGHMNPDDRPQLPPLQTYLQSCKSDMDIPARGEPYYAHRPTESKPSSQTRLPPIVTKDFPTPAAPGPRPALTEPGMYANQSSYSGSRSSLPSPYSSSPTSYGPPGSMMPTSAPYRPAGERDDRAGDASRPYERAGDPARSHSLSSMPGESSHPAYDPYPPPDRRYSAGYAVPPPPPRGGPPPGAQYPGMPPPPPGGPGADIPAHYVWEMPVAAINPNGRKRRGNLPKESTSILNDWFCQHIAFPYPKEDEKHQLQAMTGLSISQISNWFINARRRRRPEAVMRQSQAQYDDAIRWKPAE